MFGTPVYSYSRPRRTLIYFFFYARLGARAHNRYSFDDIRTRLRGQKRRDQ